MLLDRHVFTKIFVLLEIRVIVNQCIHARENVRYVSILKLFYDNAKINSMSFNKCFQVADRIRGVLSSSIELLKGSDLGVGTCANLEELYNS